MNLNDFPDSSDVEPLQADGASLLSPLLQGSVSNSLSAGLSPVAGVVIGELIAIADDGCSPLVRVAGQTGTRALRARSTVHLHGVNIGSTVVLAFENGDPEQPVVLGLLQSQPGWPAADKPSQVNVDVDGARLTVTALDQLVLRCGRASITLTKAGKVLIEGTYLSSQSTGVNRIKGGSVQLN